MQSEEDAIRPWQMQSMPDAINACSKQRQMKSKAYATQRHMQSKANAIQDQWFDDALNHI